MLSALKEKRFICPVCGFLLRFPPEDFNICPSCGVEFGSETTIYSIEELRKNWLLLGAMWSSRAHPRPKDFDPIQQLQNIPNVSSAPHVNLAQETFRFVADPSVAEVRYVTRNA